MKEYFNYSLGILTRFGLDPYDYTLIRQQVVSPSLEALKELKDASEFEEHIFKTKDMSDDEVDQYLESYPSTNRDYIVYILNGEVLNKNEFIKMIIRRAPATMFLMESLPENMEHLKLEKKLINHLREFKDGSSREEFAKMLLNNFPEYSYSGFAYKAVILKDTEDYDPRYVVPGTSWALSREGMDHFTDNSYYYDVVKLSGTIIGINLVRLLKEKFPHLLEMDQQYLAYAKEDEIIATEIIGFEVIKDA